MSKAPIQNLRDLFGDTSAHETDYPELDPNEFEFDSDDLDIEFAVKPKNLFASRAEEVDIAQESSENEWDANFQADSKVAPEDDRKMPPRKRNQRNQEVIELASEGELYSSDFLSDEYSEGENQHRKELMARKKQKKTAAPPPKIASKKLNAEKSSQNVGEGTSQGRG